VGRGIWAAEDAGSRQARLDPGVGRIAAGIGRVGDLFFDHPVRRPPASLPDEKPPADPAVTTPRDHQPEQADEHEHIAGGVQVEDGGVGGHGERQDRSDGDQ
jgi:hypothetical protein